MHSNQEPTFLSNFDVLIHMSFGFIANIEHDTDDEICVFQNTASQRNVFIWYFKELTVSNRHNSVELVYDRTWFFTHNKAA